MAYVIGTAGHVDHGKTSLVAALTGTDTDRLKEEKERGLTIDLGFTFIDLPLSGRTGIVDVPGHRDFIENMLAGAGGIDLAVLVVAADEGVMPQTQEHLAILHLLQIPQILVALTKSDLIDDSDWIELIMLDVLEMLEQFEYTDVPIISVSAVTGDGIQRLVAEIDASLQHHTAEQNNTITRLPVDRVFTIDGFGTVVTGTLISGQLSIGQSVVLQPTGKEARIRGIQNHGQALEVAEPGNRIAVNLTGIDKQDIARGDVLIEPGVLMPSKLLDVRFKHLADDDQALKHNSEMKFFSGSTEAMARVRVIGERENAPGTTGWLQLALMQPVAVVTGDRFILRRPSPAVTVGGGIILDAHPPHQWRRFRHETLAHFELLAQGSPEIWALSEINKSKIVQLRALTFDQDIIASLLDEGRLLYVDKDYIASADTIDQMRTLIEMTLQDYHSDFPLYVGLSKEALRSQLQLDKGSFNALLNYLTTGGHVELADGWVFLPSHEIRFDAEQEKIAENLLASLQENAFQTPSFEEISGAIGEDLLQALIHRGEIVRAKNGIVFHADVYGDAVRQIVNHIQINGSLTVSDARDMFGTSRKYALGLLEYLDEAGVTRRVENYRVLR